MSTTAAGTKMAFVDPLRVVSADLARSLVIYSLFRFDRLGSWNDVGDVRIYAGLGRLAILLLAATLLALRCLLALSVLPLLFLVSLVD